MLLFEVGLSSLPIHSIGDENAITIGENTNVQDRAVVISTKKNHNCEALVQLETTLRLARSNPECLFC